MAVGKEPDCPRFKARHWCRAIEL